MTDICAIGLGKMGSALARALQRSGHRVTVWNRSAARMAPFRAAGVCCAENVAEAVLASTATLVVWAAALMHISEQARASGISREFPDFVGSLLERAQDAGYGQGNVMSMPKVMRSGDV